MLHRVNYVQLQTSSNYQNYAISVDFNKLRFALTGIYWRTKTQFVVFTSSEPEQYRHWQSIATITDCWITINSLIYIYIYCYIRTYTHTYIHTYIHIHNTYIHNTYIHHTYIYMYLHTYSICIHIYLHKHIQYIHVYKHTYIHFSIKITQLNPIHYSFKVHFNILFQSLPRFSKSPLSFIFTRLNHVFLLLFLLYVLHVPATYNFMT
jgi:hypothetical protein